MGKVKNNKKKQNRVNATGVPTNAEIEEAENLQRVPVETILPLIQKVGCSFLQTIQRCYILPKAAKAVKLTLYPYRSFPPLMPTSEPGLLQEPATF